MSGTSLFEKMIKGEHAAQWTIVIIALSASSQAVSAKVAAPSVAAVAALLSVAVAAEALARELLSSSAEEHPLDGSCVEEKERCV